MSAVSSFVSESCLSDDEWGFLFRASSSSQQGKTSLGTSSFSSPLAGSEKVHRHRLKKLSKMSMAERRVHEISMRELEAIVKHPLIQAHPKHWLVRFATPDSSLEQIAQNIYQAIVEEQEILFYSSKKEEEFSSPGVSFLHFCKLYEMGREIRCNAYRNKVLDGLRLMRSSDTQRAIRELSREEEVFTASLLRFTSASFLLWCALLTNYWEDVCLIVQNGGIIPSFHREMAFFEDSRPEWMSIYQAAHYAKYGKLP